MQRLSERQEPDEGPSGRPGKRGCLFLSPQRTTGALPDLVALDTGKKAKAMLTSNRRGFGASRRICKWTGRERGWLGSPYTFKRVHQGLASFVLCLGLLMYSLLVSGSDNPLS